MNEIISQLFDRKSVRVFTNREIAVEDKNLILDAAAQAPTAGLASAFADRYHGDTENAAVFTLGTTILSVITIPVLYMLLNL